MCLQNPTTNAHVTTTTAGPPYDTTPLVSACPLGRRRPVYHGTSVVLPPPSTTPTPICSSKPVQPAPSICLQHLAHLLGLVAGLLQALGVILIHGVLSSSPRSFSIFVPMLIVAILFITISLTQFSISNSTTRNALFSSSSPLNVLLSRLAALLRLPRTAKTALLLRTGVGGMLYAASLYSLQHIPAPVAVTIFATAPSLASVFSALFLRCSVTRRDALILLVNIAGVFLVANPFHASAKSVPLTADGLFAAALNTIFIAASFTIAKSLGSYSKVVDASTHILAVGIGVLLFSPVFYQHDNVRHLLQRPGLVALLVIAEIFEWASQYVMARAIEFCHPGRLLVMRSVNVPATCALSMMFLRERLGMTQTVGVCVVLGSIVCNGLGIAAGKKMEEGDG